MFSLVLRIVVSLLALPALAVGFVLPFELVKVAIAVVRLL